jgi:hypothetical protein
MTSPVQATRAFKADFDLVARHYHLSELGELETAKQCARADMSNAIISYSAMAKEIRKNG